MNTFKDIAYQILQEVNRPLHSNEITKIALERGWLKTAGKTPESTMSAQLITDINSKKDKSRFIKSAPLIFSLNGSCIFPVKEEVVSKNYKISGNVSTKQKGDIVEARIAELIALYGDTTLSCYKPVSDDEGIDIIVKEKGSLQTMYLQVKSRFGDDPSKIFVANVKAASVVDNYAMGIVFCYFDVEKGDLWDYLWFIPAPDFIKLANKHGENFSFVAGRERRESNTWDDYMLDRPALANRIITQMNRI